MKTLAERRRGFDEHVPVIEDNEIDRAFKNGRVSLSFKADPVLIDKNEIGFIAVKIAMMNGDLETILLDQFAARMLHNLIETTNKMDWKPQNVPPVGIKS